MRQALIRGGAALVRSYYRRVPFALGKRALWHHLVCPLLRHDIELEGETGFGARMMLRLPDTIQCYVYFFGVWEPAITAYITTALAAGDTMIDVGANIGYDSLLASHCVGPSGQVFAIEASPSVFRLLRRNLALNRVGNVTALHAAVCDAPGLVPVYLHDATNLGGTTILPALARRRHAVREADVPGRRLTDLIPEAVVRRARLIKIDVEGAEWPVVRGFADFLPALSPRTELLIEVSVEGLREHGISAEEFLGVFRAAGFRPFVIDNPYRVEAYMHPRPRPPEPLREGAFEQLDLLFRRV